MADSMQEQQAGDSNGQEALSHVETDPTGRYLRVRAAATSQPVSQPDSCCTQALAPVRS